MGVAGLVAGSVPASGNTFVRPSRQVRISDMKQSVCKLMLQRSFEVVAVGVDEDVQVFCAIGFIIGAMIDVDGRLSHASRDRLIEPSLRDVFDHAVDLGSILMQRSIVFCD